MQSLTDVEIHEVIKLTAFEVAVSYTELSKISDKVTGK